MASARHAHPRFPAWLSFLLTGRRRRREYPPEAIADRLGIRPEHTVMDFGSGPGFFTGAFAAKARRVVAVDAQPAMLEKARKRLGRAAATVEFVSTEDGTVVDVPSDSVDLVFLSFVFHELGNPDVVVRELARTMRPGARLVIMERTEPARSPFNPPRVDPARVEQHVVRAGLAARERIRWSRASLLVFEKPAA